MPHRPHILIVPPMLGRLSPILESAYNVHRLWEHPPVEAQGLIQAVVVAGEDTLDTDLIDRLDGKPHQSTDVNVTGYEPPRIVLEQFDDNPENKKDGE